MTDPTHFPPDFLWGAASSSYQIEGAWDADGKGLSIWDEFTRRPGVIAGGEDGRVACDHYHHYREDVALMKAMGLQAYRFSISWPRILPAGRGRVNQAGLDFYARLVEELLEAGIQPFATLYHWDLPLVLQEQGGWPERSTADAFVEYTDVVTRFLGDRVAAWTTFNEPFISAHLGYATGSHAPGHTSLSESLRAAHHMLLAHGRALPVIRQNAPRAQAGIVLNLGPCTPAVDDEATRAQTRLADGMIHRWYLDPLAGRGYPADMVAYYGVDQEYVAPGDLAEIAAPLDFLGVNYYSRSVIHAGEMPFHGHAADPVTPGPDATVLGWEVYPRGLTDILTRLHTEYAFPALYVTENGAAYTDELTPDGAVHDPLRVAYLERHLAACAAAIQAGAPLKGYFVWSLMDNFEWAAGYAIRFGVVYIDYPTQRRVLKDSALWYGRMIAASGM
jgi:beta-glucosidase